MFLEITTIIPLFLQQQQKKNRREYNAANTIQLFITKHFTLRNRIWGIFILHFQLHFQTMTGLLLLLHLHNEKHMLPESITIKIHKFILIRFHIELFQFLLPPLPLQPPTLPTLCLPPP